MTEELKPCPFCGETGKSHEYYFDPDHNGLHYGCASCHIIFNKPEQWNTRVEPNQDKDKTDEG